MRNKSILITIVMVSSLLAGCNGDSSEEGLSDKYQEGYDAGYGDAYDASYDGVAQHHYNEGWDDGWDIAQSNSQAEILDLHAEMIDIQGLASSLNETILSLQGNNSNSQAEIMEMQELASSLNQTIQSLLDEIDAGYDGAAQHHYNEGWDDGWEIAISDSQAEIMEMQELASGLNQTIQALLAEINELQLLITSLDVTIQNLQNQSSVPLIECGAGTTVSNWVCISDRVVWGKFPFEQGTNLTINQAFMGGFTHHEDGMYAVDFSMEEGTPVVSFKPGVIIDIKEDSDTNCIDEGIELEDCNHSNFVKIDHGDFTFSTYLHLEQWSVEVEVGEIVGGGHQIGNVGNTGYSTGPHLHFEVFSGFGLGNSKIPLFEELVGISNGIAFSGLEVVSNNSNISSTTQIAPSNCPSEVFLFRGLVISSEIPCSIAEYDVEYNLTGYVISPSMDLQVAQYVHNSEGNYWAYDCIDTDSNGNFSTVLEWDSTVHNETSFLMISVTPDDYCQAYDGWWTSVVIELV
jgi:murein DD-endopeptidase MepM/ murein hydrolase activator NlpD